MTEHPPSAADEVARICQDLIRIDSSNYGEGRGDESEVAAYVVAQLREVGLEPQVVESAPGRPSVFVRLPGADSSLPALCVHGHLDVVPATAADWQVDPFSGLERDGCIWGRGAVDMKGMDAMIIATVRDLVRSGTPPRRDLVIGFFADEEAGGVYGSQWVVEQHPEIFAGGERGDQRGRRIQRHRAHRGWGEHPGIPGPDGGEGNPVAAPDRARPRRPRLGAER